MMQDTDFTDLFIVKPLLTFVYSNSNSSYSWLILDGWLVDCKRRTDCEVDETEKNNWLIQMNGGLKDDAAAMLKQSMALSARSHGGRSS